MEFRLDINFRYNKMAIPFHVPAEYGPLPVPAPHNNAPPRNNYVAPVLPLLDGNNNVRPDLLNHNRGEPIQNQMGFFCQLGTELLGVYRVLTRVQGAPRVPAFTARIRDNQRRARPQPDPQHALPDLIQCHGLLVDLSFGLNHVRLPNWDPVVQQLINEDESWSFGLKVSVSPWSEVGRDLRRISDQFNIEGSLSRRTSRRSRSFEFRLILSLPTMFLVGLGLSFLLRRQL